MGAGDDVLLPGDEHDSEWDDAASQLSFEQEDVIDERMVAMFGGRETLSNAVNLFYRKYVVCVDYAMRVLTVDCMCVLTVDCVC